MISVIRLILSGTLNERLRDKNRKKCSCESDIVEGSYSSFNLHQESLYPVHSRSWTGFAAVEARIFEEFGLVMWSHWPQQTHYVSDSQEFN